MRYFDRTTGEWKIRYLKADEGAGVGIEEDGDAIKFRTIGGDLNLTVESYFEDTDGRMVDGMESDVVLYWRNGVFVGTTAPSGDPPVGLIEQTMAKISFLS